MAAGRLAVARPAAAADGWFVSLNGALTRGVSGADKIRLAAATGYGGVDWDLGPAKTAGRDATRTLLAELKIKPTITNLPMARPFPFAGEEAAFKDALAPLADDAAFTAGIGCDKMMVVLPASTTEVRQEQLKRVRDRLAAVADVLQRSRIRLGLEFLGPLYFRQGRAGGPPATPFIWNMPDALALAKDCGPNVGVILDAWHWHHSGSTTADILAADKSRIVHVHVSDAKADAAGRRARQPAADARRRDHRSRRLLPGAEEDRLRRRRQSRTARPRARGDDAGRSRAPGAADDDRRDEEGRSRTVTDENRS